MEETAYCVHGRIARGSAMDVFLARRDGPITEMALLKVARAENAPLREWRVLADLRGRDGFLDQVLPEPIALGSARCPGRPERQAAAYRWRPGFVYTLEDVRRAHPDGVDPRAAVWMWNRLLEQLACLHALGYAHRALRPAHALVHPRDHAVLLCGWSACARGSGRQDLLETAACIESLLGASAPACLRELTGQAGSFSDATRLMRKLAAVARQTFGPASFHPFHMPDQRRRPWDMATTATKPTRG